VAGQGREHGRRHRREQGDGRPDRDPLAAAFRGAQDSKPGQLDQTTFIQRVNTTGGLAPPASECNASTAGTQAEVPYTADYYFWK
jgi:hypothetical protein